MGEGIFLFEFASKTTAEQVWWSQTIGTSADYGRPKSTWVRVVGLPLRRCISGHKKHPKPSVIFVEAGSKQKSRLTSETTSNG
ncbi:hypothetical protein H5410_026564 [Solanum commersonii]|uniref:Uncharacterized protein n=1 Tax=Solanum commersonii TaxID=4109 RepID=A0A9J5YZ74_SOLCO|nr:hypothetical protein H5410_026564 [Solanum commersonii]